MSDPIITQTRCHSCGRSFDAGHICDAREATKAKTTLALAEDVVARFPRRIKDERYDIRIARAYLETHDLAVRALDALALQWSLPLSISAARMPDLKRLDEMTDAVLADPLARRLRDEQADT